MMKDVRIVTVFGRGDIWGAGGRLLGYWSVFTGLYMYKFVELYM